MYTYMTNSSEDTDKRHRCLTMGSH